MEASKTTCISVKLVNDFVPRMYTRLFLKGPQGCTVLWAEVFPVYSETYTYLEGVHAVGGVVRHSVCRWVPSCANAILMEVILLSLPLDLLGTSRFPGKAKAQGFNALLLCVQAKPCAHNKVCGGFPNRSLSVCRQVAAWGCTCAAWPKYTGACKCAFASSLIVLNGFIYAFIRVSSSH